MDLFPGFLIHHAVEHFAHATPDHPAFLCGDESLSYGELEERANRLSHALVAAGVQRGDRVGIYMRKGLELGVAIYGILKAGGAFVPLDPFLPVQRLAFVIEDCEIRHLVSAEGMRSSLQELAAAGGPIEPQLFGCAAVANLRGQTWEDIGSCSSEPLHLPLTDVDLGYLMYTSGSTGQPKGMLHTHKGSLSYARWGAGHVGLAQADRVASHAPLHFDLSIFDFFSTGQAGGTVVLVPEAVTKFPASWTELVQSARVSVVFTVPFMLIEMLHRGALEQRDVSSLRWILFGGEPFPPGELAELMKRLPHARFTNVYGPAEAPSCTCYDVPAPPLDPDALLPIGELSANSEGLILDAEDRPCAEGEAGELCIRSSTLTRGYWGRDDLNAGAFFELEGPGAFPLVYYRTGDLVRREADGLLRFLGRKDRMVKTRGHRVELDEVEHALTAHPDVLEAAAYTVPDGAGSQTILAAAAAREPGSLTGPELLRHAKGRLPSYALPREVRILPELPRTSGGKIDRVRLAREEGSRIE